MAYLMLAGFEAGDTYDCRQVSGTCTISDAVSRSGTYSGRVYPSTTGTGYFQFDGRNSTGKGADYNKATLYIRFYIRIATLPAANYEPIFNTLTSADAHKFTLAVDSAGHLHALNQALTDVATGTATLSAGTDWYRIDMQIGTGTSATYSVKVNGADDLSGTIDTTTGNHARIAFGKTSNRNGQSVNFYYDDIAVKDDAAPAAGSIIALFPNSNSATDTGWAAEPSGEKWEAIDEAPANLGGDDIYSITNSEAYCAGLQSPTAITGTINCCMSYILVKEGNMGPTAQISLRCRYSASVSDTSSATLTTSWLDIAKIHANAPGGSAWSNAILEDTEIGIINNAALGACATQAFLMVDFTPAVVTSRLPKLQQAQYPGIHPWQLQ